MIRFVLALLAICLLPAAAGAQDSAKLTPLPSGEARIAWIRTILSEALDGVAAIEPTQQPSLFMARMARPDTPGFAISVAEEVPAIELLDAADAFVSAFREKCGPWRQRGELDKDSLNFFVLWLDCAELTPGGRFLWFLVYRDTHRLQLVALSAPAAQKADILARGDRLMNAIGITVNHIPQDLAEDLLVAHVYGGYSSLYDPAVTSRDSSGLLRHKTTELMVSGRPGAYEVKAASCADITISTHEDGPPRRVSDRLTWDLTRLRQLVTREGPNLRVKAGSYGTRTLFSVQGVQTASVEATTEEALLTPGSAAHLVLDALLQVQERFCSATPSMAATPAQAATSSAQSSAAATVSAPPAPQRACDRAGSNTNLTNGRAAGVLGATGADGQGPFLVVDAAWWRSIAQTMRQDIADIVHCGEGRWGSSLALRILDRQSRAELGAFGAGVYREGGARP